MMAKASKNAKSKNTRNKKQEEKYNADNEIIIGVTTVPKNVRVDNKKSTRTKQAKNINKRRTSNKKNMKKVNKSRSSKPKKKNIKTTKEQEIKKINTKKLVISFFILLVIIIAWMIYFLTTPMFNIANIEVTGNKKNSIETYISLSKIELNTTNIFGITKSGISKNIKENSYVESVEMKRKLPNTLQINIIEREVAYQAKYNDKYIYMDKQGYILEINNEKKNTTKILGLSSVKEALTEGQRLNNEDLLKLDTVLKIVNYCNYNSIENKISSINVSDTSNYIVNFDKEGQIAYLGDASNLSERILWLKTILEKEKGNKGEIFINGNLNDGKVYIKPNTKKD